MIFLIHALLKVGDGIEGWKVIHLQIMSSANKGKVYENIGG